MKIIDKRNKNDKVLVKHLKAGVVFCWDDCFYIKYDDQGTYPYNVAAMELTNYQVVEFEPSTEVEFIYAELVISDRVKQ